MNTLPQSTDLSPEELRVICAEGYGLTNVQGRGAWYGYLPNGNAESIPDYPTDANAALLLLEKLRTKGLTIRVVGLKDGDFKCWLPAHRAACVYAPTLPLAIARAFAIATGRAL